MGGQVPDLASTSASRSALADVLHNDHGPLLQVLLHLWTSLVGDSEFALRLPSALATVAMVPVLAALAARVLGATYAARRRGWRRCRRSSSWYGQEARNYSFAILFATLGGARRLALARGGRGATRRGAGRLVRGSDCSPISTSA